MFTGSFNVPLPAYKLERDNTNRMAEKQHWPFALAKYLCQVEPNWVNASGFDIYVAKLVPPWVLWSTRPGRVPPRSEPYSSAQDLNCISGSAGTARRWLGLNVEGPPAITDATGSLVIQDTGKFYLCQSCRFVPRLPLYFALLSWRLSFVLIFLVWQEILVCNLNKMAIGVHTPSGGIDLRLSRDLIRSTRLNVRAWTARWPIRKVSDLARPMP